MPVVEWGASLPSANLTRFNPDTNAVSLVSVLDTRRRLDYRYHWVDEPLIDVKGSYKCVEGICCQAYGNSSPARISTVVPIWVYNSRQAVDGRFLVWQLTAKQFEELKSLAERYDLSQYDIEVTYTDQGKGRRLAISIVPPPQGAQYTTLRQCMPPDMIAEISSSVEGFFSFGEGLLVRDMDDNKWMDLLQEAGYDFNQQCFPLKQQRAVMGRGSTISNLPPPPPRMLPQPAPVHMGVRPGSPVQVNPAIFENIPVVPPVQTPLVNPNPAPVPVLTATQPVIQAQQNIAQSPLPPVQPVTMPNPAPVITQVQQPVSAAVKQQPVQAPPQPEVLPQKPNNVLSLDELERALDI